jgi:hypothetical protein
MICEGMQQMLGVEKLPLRERMLVHESHCRVSRAESIRNFDE